jgi:RNA polymerase sigma-70 factor (ECF subfamily)
MDSLEWNQIVDDLGPRLYRYFCARFSKEQSDDLTQETLIRLLRKVEEKKFDPARGNMAMFTFGIAHFVALETKIDRIHEPIESWQDQIVIETNDEILESDQKTDLREAIRTLSNDEQSVLTLMMDQELKVCEISTLLSMPEGTIKSHVSRAKEKLKRILNPTKPSSNERKSTHE